MMAQPPSRSVPRRLCPPRPLLGPAAVSGGTLYGGASLPRLGPALPAAMQSQVLCLGGGAGAPAARRVRLLLRQVLAGGAAAARPGRLEVRALHGSGNHPADTRPRLPSAFSPVPGAVPRSSSVRALRERRCGAQPRAAGSHGGCRWPFGPAAVPAAVWALLALTLLGAVSWLGVFFQNVSPAEIQPLLVSIALLSQVSSCRAAVSVLCGWCQGCRGRWFKKGFPSAVAVSVELTLSSVCAGKMTRAAPVSSDALWA